MKKNTNKIKKIAIFFVDLGSHYIQHGFKVEAFFGR